MSFAYYWLGRIGEAVERSRQSVQAAKAANHTTATLFALPSLGLTLAASGRYDEAELAFAEAIRFGREYEMGTLLARAISMSTIESPRRTPGRLRRSDRWHERQPETREREQRRRGLPL